MSDSQQYFIEKKIYHGPGYSFQYDINWNVPIISGSESATGFIVQHFSRTAIPPNFVKDDIDYYEAWEVRNGNLVDTGKECDDRFIITSTLEESLRASLGTQGEYRISGDVYWLPSSSSLYNVVNSWSRKTVEQTAGLKGSYEFQMLTDDYLVFKREPFIHSWSLITENEVIFKLKNAYLNCYPNYKNDFEYLSGWLDFVFREQPDRWQNAKRIILADLQKLNEQ